MQFPNPYLTQGYQNPVYTPYNPMPQQQNMTHVIQTSIIQVDSVDALKDMGHGVNLVRKGVSGKTQNQLLEFDMKINNPALTGQILVCAARAAMRRTPGCYTMIELPVIDLLPGDPDEWIGKLV